MDAHRLARNTDPASSHEAAREHVGSGRNESQKVLVLEQLMWEANIMGMEINEGKPLTSRELAHYSDLDRYMVARRLADLKAEGKVIQSPRTEMRKCRVSGRLAVTWRLA